MIRKKGATIYVEDSNVFILNIVTCKMVAPAAPLLVTASGTLNPTQLSWTLSSWGNNCNSSVVPAFKVYVSTDTYPTTLVAGTVQINTLQ